MESVRTRDAGQPSVEGLRLCQGREVPLRRGLERVQWGCTTCSQSACCSGEWLLRALTVEQLRQGCHSWWWYWSRSPSGCAGPVERPIALPLPAALSWGALCSADLAQRRHTAQGRPPAVSIRLRPARPGVARLTAAGIRLSTRSYQLLVLTPCQSLTRPVLEVSPPFMKSVHAIAQGVNTGPLQRDRGDEEVSL